LKDADEMNTVKWVIFDLGGIVIPETWDSIIAQVAADAGVSPQRLAELVLLYHDEATKGKRTLLQVYRSVARDLTLEGSPEEALRRHLTLYRQMSAQHNPDIVALMRQLHTGHSLASLTNTEPEIAEISKQTGLFDYFDRNYFSIELGLKKPDPEIFAAVLMDLGCAPKDVVFIDDRKENVEGAISVGMRALHFRCVDQIRRELSTFCPVLTI
jgi:putative hydrolase of the HAD superfamily